MKTITVIAYNRPEYLRRTLEALKQCRGVKDYIVLVSIDGPANVSAACCSVALELDFLYRVMPCNKGINEHPYLAYEHIFGEWKSDFNVVFEDDCVPSPDALELCEWFYNHPQRDEYVCLNLFGNSLTHNNPLDLYELMWFSPYGWAVTRNKWETILKPNWSSHNNGWDWSCTYTIQRLGLKTLNPYLNRVLNIGRENGTNMSPAFWDDWAKNFVASDGNHGKDYRIVTRLREGFAADVQPWVKEYEAKTAGNRQSV